MNGNEQRNERNEYDELIAEMLEQNPEVFGPRTRHLVDAPPAATDTPPRDRPTRRRTKGASRG